MISEKSRKKVRKICIFLPLIVVFSIILILISIFFKHDYANFNFFGRILLLWYRLIKI